MHHLFPWVIFSSVMVDRPRAERLQEFFRRASALPLLRSEEEVMMRLAELLNAVEDEMTSIPNNPDNWRSDGRMYPPQSESRSETSRPDVARYRSKGRYTYVRSNGAFEIRTVRGDKLECERPGYGGEKVWQ